MKKNDLVTVKIEDFSREGLGIGHCEGLALFVKDTVIGDVAEVRITKMKKTYGYARLQRILTPSPDRVQAPCPAARACGGCQIQEMRYGAQLRFKENKVRSDLQRIGGFTDIPMEPIIGIGKPAGCQAASALPGFDREQNPEEALPFRFRNKAQMPVARGKDGRLIAGFFAGRTHHVIDCRDCLIGAKVNREILSLVLAHMERHEIDPYEETSGTGLVRHVITRVNREALGAHSDPAGAQILVCLVINGTSLPGSEDLIHALRSIPGMTGILLNSNCERTNVILGPKQRLLWGKEYLEDRIGDIRFRISMQSFYQVNPYQTEKLYNKVLEYAALTGKETVWDLYCGIGTISLFLARSAAAVCGVEIVPEAVCDARENARINGISNAEFFTGRAEDILPQKYQQEGIRADVIVADPPRKGCEKSVLDTMLQICPDRIIYVSCDSATLARDLRHLCGGGYQIAKVCPADMFGNSVHVETVCLLSRCSTAYPAEADLDP